MFEFKIAQKREKEYELLKKWKEVEAKESKKTTTTTTAMQLGDTESTVSTTVATSAVAITGLVLGATCFLMNKKRSVKTDIETSLIDKWTKKLK